MFCLFARFFGSKIFNLKKKFSPRKISTLKFIFLKELQNETSFLFSGCVTTKRTTQMISYFIFTGKLIFIFIYNRDILKKISFWANNKNFQNILFKLKNKRSKIFEITNLKILQFRTHTCDFKNGFTIDQMKIYFPMIKKYGSFFYVAYFCEF